MLRNIDTKYLRTLGNPLNLNHFPFWIMVSRSAHHVHSRPSKKKTSTKAPVRAADFSRLGTGHFNLLRGVFYFTSQWSKITFSQVYFKATAASTIRKVHTYNLERKSVGLGVELPNNDRIRCTVICAVKFTLLFRSHQPPPFSPLSPKTQHQTEVVLVILEH